MYVLYTWKLTQSYLLHDMCSASIRSLIFFPSCVSGGGNRIGPVCLSVWVCETYVVHHFLGTGLHCAPPICVVHHGAQGGSMSVRSKGHQYVHASVSWGLSVSAKWLFVQKDCGGVSTLGLFHFSLKCRAHFITFFSMKRQLIFFFPWLIRVHKCLRNLNQNHLIGTHSKQNLGQSWLSRTYILVKQLVAWLRCPMESIKSVLHTLLWKGIWIFVKWYGWQLSREVNQVSHTHFWKYGHPWLMTRVDQKV